LGLPFMDVANGPALPASESAPWWKSVLKAFALVPQELDFARAADVEHQIFHDMQDLLFSRMQTGRALHTKHLYQVCTYPVAQTDNAGPSGLRSSAAMLCQPVASCCPAVPGLIRRQLGAADKQRVWDPDCSEA
jgi:hypothetical protein